MTPTLSLNTQAILLLTAPLIAGRSTASHDLLSPGEYKRLARHLREIQRQPADLVSPDAAEILRACQPVIDESRLHKLLGRGFLLSQVIEQWQARAIWVVSRADAEYPRRLKVRLREDAPAVLYGCGDMSLLETGGLAVVGSRHVDDVLIDYTMSIGRLAARAGSALVSGGARGIDQAAMRGALEAGGKVCGVLADSLEKTAMNRDHRNLLLDGQLVLVSPYDPSAGFNVGNAMQRNKLIYALADAALVVSSDLKKGGTWTGAVEQLNKFKFVPVFTRSTGGASVAIDALVQQGAIPWPNPSDADGLREVFKVSCSADGDSLQSGSSLFDALEDDMSLASEQIQSPLAIQEDKAIPHGYSSSLSQSSGSCAREQAEPMGDLQPAKSLNATPAELLLEAVQACIQQLLTAPMNEVEVATALNVSTSQAKTWLQRLVDEGVIEKRKRPVVYVLKTQCLFD